MAAGIPEPDNGQKPFAVADSGDVEEVDEVVGEDVMPRTSGSYRVEISTFGPYW